MWPESFAHSTPLQPLLHIIHEVYDLCFNSWRVAVSNLLDQRDKGPDISRLDSLQYRKTIGLCPRGCAPPLRMKYFAARKAKKNLTVSHFVQQVITFISLNEFNRKYFGKNSIWNSLPSKPIFFQLSLTVGLCIPVKIVAIHIMGMACEEKIEHMNIDIPLWCALGILVFLVQLTLNLRYQVTQWELLRPTL